MDKKRYTTPVMRIVPVLAEQSLLSSSFVGIGGDTDHFDTQKKEEGLRVGQAGRLQERISPGYTYNNIYIQQETL